MKQAIASASPKHLTACRDDDQDEKYEQCPPSRSGIIPKSLQILQTNRIPLHNTRRPECP